MVNIGTILGLSALGLIIFFRDDIGKSLSGLKGFGKDFGKLPDVNINIPDFGNPFEGLPQVFGDAGEGITQAGIDAQKAIADALAETSKNIDTGIKTAQENFEQNIAGISQGIAEQQEASLVFGADIQEFFTGNRNAIGDFFDPTSSKDGEPIKTPTVITPATIERQAGRRTFGGQTEPKMILTKESATTPKESTLIISKQPDLSKVSSFLTNFQKTAGFEGDNNPQDPLLVERRAGRRTF